MQYVILIDLGNTNIKIGILKDTASDNPLEKAWQASYRLPSLREHTADSFGLELLRFVGHAGIELAQIKCILACSVVPKLNSVLALACKKYLKAKLYFTPEDVTIDLENLYAEKSQVGADRLVGAHAARILYPEPASIICVDYGTATTFDCIEGDAYLGGLICPGVFTSVDALARKAAKLPQINLDAIEGVEGAGLIAGKSTSISMNHGFLYGFTAMTEGLCARLKTHLKAPCFVLATGGFAENLSKVSNCFDAVRVDLLLEGLKIIYEQKLR